MSPNIQPIHQAVCANFPEIITYGTLRSPAALLVDAHDVWARSARAQAATGSVGVRPPASPVDPVSHGGQRKFFDTSACLTWP